VKPYWLGLDIGGTKCAVLLAKVDAGIHILDKIRFATESDQGFTHVYNQLLQAIETLITRNQLDFSRVEAIGISCGGPLDSRKGIVLCPPNLPGWVNIPICDMLSEKYGIPAYLQNDANACALVEWKLGAGRGTQNMLFLTMGTGMGAGIIAEGKLLVGYTDMGGEVGHLRLTEEGPVGFGKAGSFEGYTSGGGIQRQAQELTRQLIAQGQTPPWIADGCSLSEVDAKVMAQYARAGNTEAKSFFNHIGNMLGRGIALLVDAFNPEKIVIGSIFVRCEDLLRPSMERALKQEALPFALEGMTVVPGQTGEALGDLASIMTALYAKNIDPMMESSEKSSKVLKHFDRLFERYPILKPFCSQIMEAYLLMRRCYEQGGKVLIAGNGGSCADSEHIVGELMKGFLLRRPLYKKQQEAIREYTQGILSDASSLLQQGLPAIALSNHAALNSAVSNDLHPLLPAAQQVIGYGKPQDVFIGISTSGNAQNVFLAACTAKALGLSTIGLTGGNGGRLKDICDCAIIAPANTPADVQELHLPIYHTLCAMLEAKFFQE